MSNNTKETKLKGLDPDDIKVGDEIAKRRPMFVAGYYVGDSIECFEILKVARITPKRTKIYFEGRNCPDALESRGNKYLGFQFYEATDKLKEISRANRLRCSLIRNIYLYATEVSAASKKYNTNKELFDDVREYVLGLSDDEVKRDMDKFCTVQNVIASALKLVQ